MILVFDLDDTLYEEITFVKGALYSVAQYLNREKNIDESEQVIYQKLLSVLLQQGRGKVFNEVLADYGICSKSEVKKCLSVYRSSKPNISLFPEAQKCLQQFKKYPKYLVTDGNKVVQRNKIAALKIQSYFKKTIPTYQYGLRHSKPSTFVFRKILKWENAEPKDLVYIGDNPNKDFVNLKAEGFKTIRVLTGMFKNVTLAPDMEAHFSIHNLNKMTEELLVKLSKLS